MTLKLSGPTLLEDGTIRESTITVQGAHILDLRPGLDSGADFLTDGVIAPGFLDLQLNGGYGCDFTGDAASIAQVAARLPETGVTGFLPTRITSPLETYAAWLREAAAVQVAAHDAQVLGVHLEGVYFSPQRTGAHNPALMRQPNAREIVETYACHPIVRIVTLAPELEGALDAIRALRARGVVVSAGHTNATFDEAQRGLQAGIGWATHLFNAMRELRHREPGVATAMLLSDLPVGLIADGVHLHPAITQMICRIKGPRGVVLVTDSMGAMGMPPGEYNLGGYSVIVDGRSAQLPTGTLAGSILTMDGAIRHLVREVGCPLADALTMATRTPADLLGLPNKGRIAAANDADLVVLDAELRVQATVVAGGVAYSR